VFTHHLNFTSLWLYFAWRPSDRRTVHIRIRVPLPQRFRNRFSRRMVNPELGQREFSVIRSIPLPHPAPALRAPASRPGQQARDLLIQQLQIEGLEKDAIRFGHPRGPRTLKMARSGNEPERSVFQF
jgi:hypothetical protein